MHPRERALFYRPFHKTLPRSSAFVKWISVRFYETDCTIGKQQVIFVIGPTIKLLAHQPALSLFREEMTES